MNTILIYFQELNSRNETDYSTEILEVKVSNVNIWLETR